MTLTTPRGFPYPEYTDPMQPAQQIQALATAVDTDMATLYSRVNAGKHQDTCYLRSVSTNQAVAANTNVTATFATEVFDPNNMANLGTSNTTINILTTGIYLVSGNATFGSPGSPNAGSVGMWLENNGTGGVGLFARQFGLGASTVNTDGLTAQMVVLLLAGSNVQMVMRQTGTATIQCSNRFLFVTKMAAP